MKNENNMNNKILLLIIALSSVSFCFGQNIKYGDYIYNDNIKTVLIYRQGWEFTYPIISLSGGQKLVLKFDDLGKGQKDYSYTIKHCTSDWQPSQLNSIEYIQGYSEEQIEDVTPSFNTLISYNHYELVFPSEDMQITKSGNYILYVYDSDDADKPVLTRRFYVVDEKVKISATVQRSTIVNYQNTSQEISFKITDKDNIIKNPYDNLSVVILQNNIESTKLTGFSPTFIKSNLYEYYNPREIRFLGGSEYRYFNTKSVKYVTDRVKNIEFKDPYYFFELYAEKSSPTLPYSYTQDINGDILIIADDVDDYDTEAEYSYVDFTLVREASETGNFYVLGGLSDHKLSKNMQMKYNYGRKAYELRALLKQGFYNYKYVYALNDSSEIDNSLVEGNYYETENNYVIYIYYTGALQEYDELIGVKIINSYPPKKAR